MTLLKALMIKKNFTITIFVKPAKKQIKQNCTSVMIDSKSIDLLLNLSIINLKNG